MRITSRVLWLCFCKLTPHSFSPSKCSIFSSRASFLQSCSPSRKVIRVKTQDINELSDCFGSLLSPTRKFPILAAPHSARSFASTRFQPRASNASSRETQKHRVPSSSSATCRARRVSNLQTQIESDIARKAVQLKLFYFLSKLARETNIKSACQLHANLLIPYLCVRNLSKAYSKSKNGAKGKSCGESAALRHLTVAFGIRR